MFLKAAFVLICLHIAKSFCMECWHCDNARNNAECLEKGRKETCREVNSFCAVEVRVGNGQTRITKRCKQNVACKNNEMQIRLRDKFRRCIGGSYHQEQYCYCCCDGDGCNESELDCIPYPQPKKRTPPKPEPKCMPLEPPAFGSLNCSDKNDVNSQCKFSCNDRMDELYPAAVTDTTCLPSQRWSQEVPCCSRKCPPMAKMDIAIVLDSSKSIKENNWEIGKKFVEAIMRVFKVGEYSTRYSVFRFNTEIDEMSLINFNSYYDQTELLKGLKDINYQGKGTLTGKALKYLKSNVLKRDRGCRMDDRVPTVVLLFTDGKARDNTGPIAKSLRQTCEVITIWVKNEEIERIVKRDVNATITESSDKKTERQLKRISGKRNQNNFFTFESFNELRKEVEFSDGAEHHPHEDGIVPDGEPEPTVGGGLTNEEENEDKDEHFYPEHIHKDHPSENDLSQIEYYDGTTREILNRLKEIGCEQKCRSN